MLYGKFSIIMSSNISCDVALLLLNVHHRQLKESEVSSPTGKNLRQLEGHICLCLVSSSVFHSKNLLNSFRKEAIF